MDNGKKHGRKWLVQALLRLDAVEVRPFVVERCPDGVLRTHVFVGEEGATIFVNGCVALCASADAVNLLGKVICGGESAPEVIQKTDTALRRHCLYAACGAGDVVAVLVPFGCGPISLI